MTSTDAQRRHVVAAFVIHVLALPVWVLAAAMYGGAVESTSTTGFALSDGIAGLIVGGWLLLLVMLVVWSLQGRPSLALYPLLWLVALTLWFVVIPVAVVWPRARAWLVPPVATPLAR
jgi:hypothetical protein